MSGVLRMSGSLLFSNIMLQIERITCQWTIWLRKPGKCRGISELSKNAMGSLCVLILTLVVDVFYVVVLVIDGGI